jgi:hypothetical protein
MTNPLSHLTAALLATVLAGASSALAQQEPAPQSFSDLSRPTAEATPHAEYVKTIARTAVEVECEAREPTDMSEAGGCACFVTKGETLS